MISNKNKPVVEDVIISKEELEEFNSALKAWSQNKKSNQRLFWWRMHNLRRNSIKKKILEDLEGYGQGVDWYCDKCFERWVVS